MSKRNRHGKPLGEKTVTPEKIEFTADEALALARHMWREAIERDRWCGDCNSPLMYIEAEDTEFCLVCEATKDAAQKARRNILVENAVLKQQIEKLSAGRS